MSYNKVTDPWRSSRTESGRRPLANNKHQLSCASFKDYVLKHYLTPRKFGAWAYVNTFSKEGSKHPFYAPLCERSAGEVRWQDFDSAFCLEGLGLTTVT